MMTDFMPERYVETKVVVPRNLADAVCSFIVDNITNGMVLEEEDGMPTTGITFYVPDTSGSEYKQKLTEYLTDLLGSTAAAPFIEEKLVRNVEWVEQYKASVKPIVVAEDIVVRPPWESVPEGTRYDIVIEPKMAFGTGSHETTRGCLTVMRRLFKPGMRMLDLGTGSGILSILAAKMGAAYIKAIDYDIVAVENCGENFVINQISITHDILLGSLEKCEHDRAYEFVCANIIKSTILPMIPRLLKLTAPNGILALSGLLQQDESDISAALGKHGQDRYEILRDNEWLTYSVTKK
jgi:ribosomal protein L11 methyltransferase